MFEIGSYNTLVYARHSDIGLYLTSDGQDEILLPRKYCPEDAQLGDSINVFVYKDSEERPVATTLHPKATVGQFAKLRVKDVTKIGAFLDWGLEKDLFLPFREQQRKLKVDDWCIVYVDFDDLTGRIVATTWLRKHFSPEIRHLSPGDSADLIVYSRSAMGISVVVNQRHSGLVHAGNEFHRLEIGDELAGFIQKVRDDGMLDIILRKPGYDGVLDTTEVVLKKLREAGGTLPVNAKSSADEIRETFDMSRKMFKKIIGNLYKTGVIDIDDDLIRLK